MGISRKTLGEGEQVILHMRTHGKALIWPIVALVLLGAALGAGIALLPDDTQPWGPWVAVGLFVILVMWLVLQPFLRWLTTTYSVTDRRIITRRGILNKSGHDLPLRRINNVNYHRSLTDRILGCGTLVLETAAGQPLVLHDLPRVEQVHVRINNLLFQRDDEWSETPSSFNDDF
ncbi:MAG: PH domain-containing protein [Arachnia sp.]